MSWAFTSTKWTLDLATRLIKADVRLHNAEAIQPDMAIIFVVNHFTRLETILLPYQIHKATGREVWSLADSNLFVGRVGDYLRAMGTVSTKDPDRDRIIIHSLLAGDHPWIIFPEGLMVKDKKVIDPSKAFAVHGDRGRRPPHRGAASLALRAEFYRHKLDCLSKNPNHDGLERILQRFGLSSLEHVLSKRTVIVPVNVTYYPIRAQENVFVRLARTFSQDISPRNLEELSLEGTILSSDTDIDVTLGEPIDILRYLEAPEFAEMMACGEGDIQALESDPRSEFNQAAKKLMLHHMSEIYRLTTVNYDHIFATLIRKPKARRFTEREFRNRVFLCAHRIKGLSLARIHTLLATTYRDILYEEDSPKFQDFIHLCLQEGVLQRQGNGFTRRLDERSYGGDFHTVRIRELTRVIANEIEPLPRLVGTIEEISRLPRKQLSAAIRQIFLEEDTNLFHEDYARWKSADSPAREIGAPFLLTPPKPRGGIVLAHGYLAAPPEVRGLAEHLFRKGYAVYGVRLKGHGTSPEDLASSRWEDWYESFNRGYAIIKSLTDRIILAGFSTGGALALLAAARKGGKVSGVFAINTPLILARTAARLAPSLFAVNTLAEKVRKGGLGLEFVESKPENSEINYRRNPVSGIAELNKLIAVLEKSLPAVEAPTFLIQGSKDPVVDPTSGNLLFDKVGTPRKELLLMERSRHGILFGEGAEEVHERIDHFLGRLNRSNKPPGAAIRPAVKTQLSSRQGVLL